MKCSIFLLVVAVFINVAMAKPPRKIIQGENAEVGEFPYMAMLRRRGKAGRFLQHCGGSIISPRHVLTAAHCVLGVVPNPVNDIHVVTGTNANVPGAGVIHQIKAVTPHPEYDGTAEASWRNDIAVITIQDNIDENALHKIANLPSEDLKPGSSCVASGWGDITFPTSLIPNNIMKAEMHIVSNEECQRKHSRPILDTQLCAFAKRGTGLCFGDSGGPLVNDGVVYGIASWVKPCAQGYPDVFTRVSTYVDWIRGVIGKN